MSIPHFACLAAVVLCTTAHADKPEQSIVIKGGITAFLNGQSNVPSHRIKPIVRAEWQRQYNPDAGFGMELMAIADKNENYRLMGGFLNVRGRLYSGSVFECWWMGGWGLGTAPKILYTDLETSHLLTIYGHMGFEFRWLVNDSIALGVDLLSENLTQATLDATIGFRF